MTNNEILTKAIDKALKNDWGMFGHNNFYKNSIHLNVKLEWTVINEKLIVLINNGKYEYSINDILFEQENVFNYKSFAKAFWGEDEVDGEHEKGYDEGYWCGGNGSHYGAYFCGEKWIYHLQQLVSDKEPLKYIEKYL